VQRRQRLLDSATTLLRDRDYSKVMVRDVAEHAGVALGTLYHYFASKEQLFSEVLITWAASLGTNVVDHPLAGDTPLLRLKETLHRAIRAFERQPEYAKLLVNLTMTSGPYTSEAVANLDATTRAIYYRCMEPIPQSEAKKAVDVIQACFGAALRRSVFYEWVSLHEVSDELDQTLEVLEPFFARFDITESPPLKCD
jgi:AcrR family transcriptional regulator